SVTKIRASVITAIEAGRFAPCGGDVYARGHLRSIAGVLGQPPTLFLERYDELSGAATVLPLASGAQSEPDQRALRGLSERRNPSWLLAAIAAAAVVVVIAAVSLLSPTSSKNLTVSGGTPNGPVAPTTAPATSAPPAPQSSAPAGGPTVAFAGVNVVVKVHDQASWVHVVDETGRLVFQGIVQPGESRPFHAAQRLAFIFGFGPAVDLTVNGRSVGTPPVDASQVSKVAFDASGSGQPG
ncbi:MAG TPA: helix-turn-helix domain-containing protein, partial [Nakamurella sp.]